MIILAIGVAWIGCGLISYRLFRHNWIAAGLRWTKNDKKFMAALSLFGPMSLAAATLRWFSHKSVGS